MYQLEMINNNSDEWLVLPYIEEFIERTCNAEGTIEAIIGSGSYFRGLIHTPYSKFRFKNQRISDINFGVNDGIDLRFVRRGDFMLTPKKENTIINIGNKSIKVVTYHKSIVIDKKNICEARQSLKVSVARIYDQGIVLYSKETNNSNKLTNGIYRLKELAFDVYSNPPFEKDNETETLSRLNAISELEIEIIKIKMNGGVIDGSIKSLLMTLCLYLNGVWEPRKRYEKETYLLVDSQYYQQVMNLVSLDDIKGLLQYIKEKYCYEELVKIDPRENLNKLKQAGLH